MIEFAVSLVLAAGLVGVGGWCCWTAVKYERVAFREAPRLIAAAWLMGHALLWSAMFALAGLVVGLVAAGVARLVMP